MNQLKGEGENCQFEDDFDAVIMAVSGTDNYDVSIWWCTAIRIVAQDKYPDLENEFIEVIEHLSDAIHRFHPDIIEEKWNNRIIK